MSDPLTIRDCLAWVGTQRLLEIRMTNPGRHSISLGDEAIYCPVKIEAVGLVGKAKRKMAKVSPVGGRGWWWVDVTRLHRMPKAKSEES